MEFIEDLIKENEELKKELIIAKNRLVVMNEYWKMVKDEEYRNFENEKLRSAIQKKSKQVTDLEIELMRTKNKLTSAENNIKRYKLIREL